MNDDVDDGDDVDDDVVLWMRRRVDLYPYGGATYAISQAMLHAVGRDNWEKFMYRLQCTNADINVATAIFSAGYSIHQFDHVLGQGSFAPHHVHTIKEQMDTFHTTRQPSDVIEAACAFHNISGLVGQGTFRQYCK